MEYWPGTAADYKDDNHDTSNVAITKTLVWSALASAPELSTHWDELHILYDVSPTFSAWTTPTALTATFTADLATSSGAVSVAPTAASRMSRVMVTQAQASVSANDGDDSAQHRVGILRARRDGPRSPSRRRDCDGALMTAKNRRQFRAADLGTPEKAATGINDALLDVYRRLEAEEDELSGVQTTINNLTPTALALAAVGSSPNANGASSYSDPTYTLTLQPTLMVGVLLNQYLLVWI